ncbi:MAG: 3-hydroxybutyrate dehydrogenase [Acetobacterales bacterium]
MTVRSAIITGSTSGIGLGVARTMAEAGFQVCLNARKAEEGDKLAKEIADATGVKTAFVAGDISKPDDWTRMVRGCEDALGAVDILINNAGIQHTAPIVSFPKDKWDQIIGINLSGAFHGIQAVLPGMLERDWGRIVNIASVHGLIASKEKAAYVAAKHGIIGMTKVVALEMAGRNVTCNSVCPGWVLTPLVEKQISDRAEREGKTFKEAKQELLSEKQPSKQFVTPEQLGDVCVMLCTRGGEQLTGQAIAVDGGWTAQ